jgi:hypothetical protein
MRGVTSQKADYIMPMFKIEEDMYPEDGGRRFARNVAGQSGPVVMLITSIKDISEK